MTMPGGLAGRMWLAAVVMTGGAAVVGGAWPAEWPAAAHVAALFLSSCAALWLVTAAPTGKDPVVISPGPEELAGERLRRPEPRPEITDALPERTTFRGRRAAIDALVPRLRRTPDGHPQMFGTHGSSYTGPSVVLIHGMAGVGKTALAQEIATLAASHYPDGLLYVNLGDAADGLSVSEVLAGFLHDLGVSDDIPKSQLDRGVRFRELTAGLRMLFVIDAARDAQQVEELLPNERGCGAIVTSRRDLGRIFGAASHRLGLLDRDDAIDMLYAVALLKPGESPDCAAEIVDACDRLPLAIQSAGERVSQEGTAIGEVRTMLRDESERLELLSRLGRSVEEGFAAEYDHLTDSERRALCLLSRIKSPTFLPWVLCPLLQKSFDEATDLCNRLSQAQLIELVERDSSTAMVRYRMHPLVRLFAEHRIEIEGIGDTVGSAINRFGSAYRDAVAAVVAYRDKSYQLDQRSSYLPNDLSLRERIVLDLHESTTVEYSNIVLGMNWAYAADQHGLVWRVGVMVGGAIPEDVDVNTMLGIFERAIEAADADTAFPLAAVDTRIAKAASLVALERYAMAELSLADARDQLTTVATHPDVSAGAVLLRQGQIRQRWGEALVQMRSPHAAQKELAAANQIFKRLGPAPESTVVRLNRALLLGIDMHTPHDQLAQQVGAANQFLVAIEEFEERRRGHAWAEAHDRLNEAARLCSGDIRRRANVLYRRARLCLDEYEWIADSHDRPGSPGPAVTHPLVMSAIRRAYDAVLVFRRMDNAVGAVRATHLVVRALAAADSDIRETGSAEVSAAEKECARIAVAAGPAFEPLKARVCWSKGILLMATKSPAEARAALQTAAEIFLAIEDGRSLARVNELLRKISEEERRSPEA